MSNSLFSRITQNQEQSVKNKDLLIIERKRFISINKIKFKGRKKMIYINKKLLPRIHFINWFSIMLSTANQIVRFTSKSLLRQSYRLNGGLISIYADSGLTDEAMEEYNKLIKFGKKVDPEDYNSLIVLCAKNKEAGLLDQFIAHMHQHKLPVHQNTYQRVFAFLASHNMVEEGLKIMKYIKQEDIRISPPLLQSIRSFPQLYSHSISRGYLQKE